MKRSRGALRPFTFLLLLALLFPLFSRVEAHGGGAPQLVNEPAGPYWLSVWTSPDPARAREPLHLTIGVTEPGSGREAGAPVLGADVRISLSAAEGAGMPVSATAAGGANKLLYEADVNLPEVGLWTVQVDVDGRAGQSRVSFDLEVAEAGGASWLLWGGGGVLLIAVLFVLAGRRR